MNDTIIIHTDYYANWIFDPTHPTQGRRFTNGVNMIQALTPGLPIIEPRPATYQQLSTMHSATYLSQVLHSHISGEWDGRRPDMAELATLFVGGTLTALESLLNEEALTAIHLPGAKHHAMRDHSSGFCVFADFAIAARIAADHGKRVAIFDIDAHHGDGTEALTLDEDRILTYSVHEWGIFPGTGEFSLPEKKAINYPLPRNSGNPALMNAVYAFAGWVERHQADIIFIAGGADGHETDPLSTLDYTHLGFQTAMMVLREIFPTIPILFGGAGGYQPDDETPLAWASMVKGLVTAPHSSTPQQRLSI